MWSAKLRVYVVQKDYIFYRIVVALRMECVDLSVKAELVKGGLITIIPHTKCLESTENLLRKGAGK